MFLINSLRPFNKAYKPITIYHLAVIFQLYWQLLLSRSTRCSFGLFHPSFFSSIYLSLYLVLSIPSCFTNCGTFLFKLLAPSRSSYYAASRSTQVALRCDPFQRDQLQDSSKISILHYNKLLLLNSADWRNKTNLYNRCQGR